MSVKTLSFEFDILVIFFIFNCQWWLTKSTSVVLFFMKKVT